MNVIKSNDSPMLLDCIGSKFSWQKSPRSPLLMPSEKPSVDAMPISPTSTADVFLILDESLGSQLNIRPKPDPSFLDGDPDFFDDDDISLSYSDDDDLSLSYSDDEMEEDQEELVGLSSVKEEKGKDNPVQPTRMEE